jgi:hypothetical protein
MRTARSFFLAVRLRFLPVLLIVLLLFSFTPTISAWKHTSRYVKT